MIGTIRKHSTWVWAIIITVVIISFVFWGAPNKYSNTDSSGQPTHYGVVANEPVKLEEIQAAQREAILEFRFNHGDWPGADAARFGFDVNRESYSRIFVQRKAKEMGIHVSDETVMQKAGDIVRSSGRTPFSAFEKEILAPGGLNGNDFQGFIRHELERMQLENTVAASGRLITPKEAQTLYERENEELATEAVFFTASNYLSGVTVSPEAVNQFFTNRGSLYRIPDRVQVKYVAFDISNRLAEAESELLKTNIGKPSLTEMVEDYSKKIGTNLYSEAKSPEEKKALIRADIIKDQATGMARREANDFARALYDLTANGTPPRTPNVQDFEKFAAAGKHAVKLSEPFDSQHGPTNITVLASFIKEAFARTPEEPVAGPLPGKDAVYVIALDKRIASEMPPFESVRDRVTEDYKISQATIAAQKAGAEFAAALTNGLAAGKKFSSICLENHVKPVAVPPLSLSTRTNATIEEHVGLYQYKQAAFTAAQPGHASEFVGTVDGGFVVFVRDRLPIDQARLNVELPDFMNRVRYMRQREVYSAWFRRNAGQDAGFARIMQDLAQRDQPRPRR